MPSQGGDPCPYTKEISDTPGRNKVCFYSEVALFTSRIIIDFPGIISTSPWASTFANLKCFQFPSFFFVADAFDFSRDRPLESISCFVVIPRCLTLIYSKEFRKRHQYPAVLNLHQRTHLRIQGSPCSFCPLSLSGFIDLLFCLISFSLPSIFLFLSLF